MDAIDVVAANRVGRAPNVAAGRRAAVDALLHAAGAVLIVVEALGAHEAACAVGLKLAAITRRRNNIALVGAPPLPARLGNGHAINDPRDRKSTRLNSSH